MAFSLADHLLSTQQAALTTLFPEQDKTAQRQAILAVLAHFIQLDSNSAEASYKAIKFSDISYFSQGIQAIPESQVVQISGLLIAEINQLDDAAAFGQEGVSELIQGQAEYLGTATQTATNAEPETHDVDSNIASLNKIMFNASRNNSNGGDDARFLSFYRIFKLSILIFIIAAIIFWFIR